MDPRFSPHNTHLEDPARFRELDPQLRNLAKQIWVHQPALLHELPVSKPGIYTIGGSRQIGKSTLLKQWMAMLMASGIENKAIVFFSGELIDDQHMLVRLLQDQIATMPGGLRYILLDEATYIKDWDKGIKYLADAGIFENCVVLITGSDLRLIEEARMRFPGRRGKADVVDFHMFPLSFREFVELTAVDQNPPSLDRLFERFDRYLIHGGFLTAINELDQIGEITAATLSTYSDWIRGDVIKRGKQEHYLREVLASIVKRYNSQISWTTLAKDLSIDHPQTVADYAELLASMDALIIQPALLEDKLTGAPKKARKVVFSDPFIHHAVLHWLNPTQKPFEKIQGLLKDSEHCSELVEACVTAHFHRFYDTYYIKAEGEVDIAYVDRGRFWPIEVKWTNQLRAKDLKQIAKYPNGQIWAKTKDEGLLSGVPTKPLPLALMQLSR